jgi:signal peptidase II
MRFWGIALAALLSDYITKDYVKERWSEGMSVPVIENVFHITYVLNPGAAFGLWENQRALFLAVSSCLLLFVLLFFKRIKEQPALFQTGLALFSGGACGNLADRLYMGKVVDFLDFRVWPVFNVADMAICLGAGCILWSVAVRRDI